MTNIVEKVREELNATLKKELGDVKYMVTNMTSEATEHREVLQRDYAEKLEKMKGIVTTFFNKYERCLMK